MSLLSEIEEQLKAELGSVSEWPRVLEVCVGLYLAGVVLEGGAAGIAYVPHLPGRAQHGFESGGLSGLKPGFLRSHPVAELLAAGGQGDPVLQTVAMAVLNALSGAALKRRPRAELVDEQGAPVPVLQILAPRSDDRVALVGAMAPYIVELEGRVADIHLFEREPQGLQRQFLRWLRPARQMGQIMRECSLVIITGAALANHSLDSILPLCGEAREVAVVGPSASVVPEPLFRRGVTLVGGIDVIEPELAMRVISEGGSGRALSARCVRKRSFRCSRAATEST